MNIGRTRRDLEIRQVGGSNPRWTFGHVALDIWLVKEGLRLDRHFALWIRTLRLGPDGHKGLSL